jgi:hypothetical protein
MFNAGEGEGRGVWEKSESNNYIPFGVVVNKEIFKKHVYIDTKNCW